MDIRQLTYFKTIVEEGTISKAAKTLHIAQPPLSMQLKFLEEELGVSLVKRLPRKIELTEEGKVLYKRALQILELCEETQREVKDTSYYQRLHIGITSSNGGFLMKSYLSQIRDKYPDLAFEIHEGNTYDMIDLVKTHIIDLAFIRTPFDSTGLNFKYLKNEPMIAVGGKEFLKNDCSIQLQDLKDIPLILYRRYENLIIDSFMNQHVSPVIICKNDDCRTSLLWANMHQGVAIVPESALYLQMIPKDIKKVPILQKELYSSIVLIWRNDQELSSVIKEFIENIG